jgi:hypothetical protein
VRLSRRFAAPTHSGGGGRLNRRRLRVGELGSGVWDGGEEEFRKKKQGWI